MTSTMTPAEKRLIIERNLQEVLGGDRMENILKERELKVSHYANPYVAKFVFNYVYILDAN